MPEQTANRQLEVAVQMELHHSNAWKFLTLFKCTHTRDQLCVNIVRNFCGAFSSRAYSAMTATTIFTRSASNSCRRTARIILISMWTRWMIQRVAPRQMNVTQCTRTTTTTVILMKQPSIPTSMGLFERVCHRMSRRAYPVVLQCLESSMAAINWMLMIISTPFRSNRDILSKL